MGNLRDGQHSLWVCERERVFPALIQAHFPGLPLTVLNGLSPAVRPLMGALDGVNQSSSAASINIYLRLTIPSRRLPGNPLNPSIAPFSNQHTFTAKNRRIFRRNVNTGDENTTSLTTDNIRGTSGRPFKQKFSAQFLFQIFKFRAQFLSKC